MQSLTELAAALLGVDKAELEAPSWATASRLLLSPSEQARELQGALRTLAGSGGNAATVAAIAADVVNQLMERQAGRIDVPVDVLFPPAVRRPILAAVAAGSGPVGGAGADGAAAAAAVQKQQPAAKQAAPQAVKRQQQEIKQVQLDEPVQQVVLA